MSKTQYYCASSLDGYIAESDDTIDWLQKYEGSYEGEGAEPMKGSYDRFYEDVGALVMGSATYGSSSTSSASGPTRASRPGS